MSTRAGTRDNFRMRHHAGPLPDLPPNSIPGTVWTIVYSSQPDRRMPRSRAYLLLTIAIGLLTFAFYVGLESYMRPYALHGMYFQEWSSETMMQTLSIEDLRRAPFQSLWNLHMQPPLLDAIRAILAHVASATEGAELVREVDQNLYLLWAFGAAMLAVVMFRWLTQLTSTTLAFIATLLFMIHPGVMFYATLLDGTFLSSILIFGTYYELWKLRRNPTRSILPVTFLFIALALLRTLFQWPAIIVFAAALILMKVPKRSLLTYLAICLVVVGSYITKQYVLFGTTSSFGWRGLNMCRSIGSTDRYELGRYQEAIHSAPITTAEEGSLPAALSRRVKVSGTPNLNHVSFLALNRDMADYCSARLKELPLTALLQGYRVNWDIYFSPSSRYVTENEIVKRLPWREGYDTIFSSPILPAAIGFALVVTTLFLRGTTLLPHLGLLLPAAYILTLSVIGERGENMRLKIFLEPLFYVFVIGAIYKISFALIWRRNSLR